MICGFIGTTQEMAEGNRFPVSSRGVENPSRSAAPQREIPCVFIQAVSQAGNDLDVPFNKVFLHSYYLLVCLPFIGPDQNTAMIILGIFIFDLSAYPQRCREPVSDPGGLSVRQSFYTAVRETAYIADLPAEILYRQPEM
jgi:hypothetical protein